eukprot:g3149.t1
MSTVAQTLLGGSLSESDGITLWSKDFCYHGHANQFIESLQLRFFVRAMFSLVFLNFHDSASLMEEKQISPPQYSHAGWTFMRVHKPAKPGDCIGVHFYADITKKRLEEVEVQEPDDDDAKSAAARSKAGVRYDGAEDHAQHPRSRADDMTPGAPPPDVTSPYSLNSTLAQMLNSMGPCGSVVEATHLWTRNVERSERLRGWEPRRRMFAVENCRGLVVAHYRLAPQLKWCDRGREVFSSSQKRVMTMGFGPNFQSASTMWWRDELGVQDSVDSEDRDIVPFERLNEFIMQRAGHFSLVCTYLNENHKYAPDYALAKESLSCPGGQGSSASTFVVLGNFAWQYCVQELFAVMAMTDLNTKPGPTKQEIEYIQGILQRNALFQNKVLVDYEIPQFDLWAFSTRGLRYDDLDVEGDEDVVVNEQTTSPAKLSASEAGGGAPSGGKRTSLRPPSRLPLTDLYRVDEFNGGTEKRSDYGLIAEHIWRSRHPWIAQGDENAEQADEEIIPAESTSRDENPATTSPPRQVDTCSMSILDHELHLPREYRAAHNEEKKGARLRKKLDYESWYADRESAMRMIGSGTAFSFDAERPSGRQLGRLEHHNYYDGRAVGRNWQKMLQRRAPADNATAAAAAGFISARTSAAVGAPPPSEIDVSPGEALTNQHTATFTDTSGAPFGGGTTGTLMTSASLSSTLSPTSQQIKEMKNKNVAGVSGRPAASASSPGSGPGGNDGDRRLSQSWLSHFLRLDPIATLLNLPHASYWRLFHRTMHVEMLRMLDRIGFYPTHVLYLCPFTHKLLDHVGLTSQMTSRTEKDEEGLRTCPRPAWEQRLKFFQIPYPTKNVFVSETDEFGFEDDEDHFKGTFHETKRVKREAVVHKTMRERDVDLFYAGNCMMEHQREMFVPGAVGSDGRLRLDADEDPDLNTPGAGGGFSRLSEAERKKSSNVQPEDQDQETPLIVQKNDPPGGREGESQTAPSLQFRTSSPPLRFRVFGHSQERLASIYMGPNYLREFARNGVELSFVQKADEVTNDAKYALYNDARVCYTHNLLQMHFRFGEESFVVKWLRKQVELENGQVQNMLFRDLFEERTAGTPSPFSSAAATLKLTDIAKHSAENPIKTERKRYEALSFADWKQQYRLKSFSAGDVAAAATSSPTTSTRLGYPSKLPVTLFPQLKARGIEAALGRCLNLVRRDHWGLLEDYFEPGKDFLYFSTMDEAVAIARRVRELYSDSSPGADLANQRDREMIEEMLTSAYEKAKSYGFSVINRKIDEVLAEQEA